MLRILVSAAALLMLCYPSLSGQASSRPSPHAIEIDGRRNPELLPEYLVWRNSFRALAAIKEENGSLARRGLLLPADATAVVLKEAQAQVARDDRCFDRQEQRREALRSSGVGSEKIREQLDNLTVECRWDVLGARDRLLASLSPLAKLALVTWVNEQRSAIHVYLPKDALEFFRQPR